MLDIKNKNIKTRIEHDSIGGKSVPDAAYYGIQTLRAVENFPITGHKAHSELIRAIAEVKKAAAVTNYKVKRLSRNRAQAIIKACEEIISGKLHNQFIVDPIQGGAGTSFNMNANELIANRAIEIMGGEKGNYSIISPNDHVNYGQSTNDAYPSSGKIAILRLIEQAQSQLYRLYEALIMKSKEFNHIIKMGRTQLQDAIPIRLGQEFKAYASVIKRDIKRFEEVKKDMQSINLGGTAIGTGLNADKGYFSQVVKELAKITNLNLFQASDLIDATQNLDGYVAVSNISKSCAINLSKICNDLRLMSSGPRAGLGEINLPARQNGSSIMPGKINPVIPEVVNQVAYNIIGNDLTITMAAEAGQLELNAFEPVIFYNLFQSIEMITNATKTLVDNCIVGITANDKHCKSIVENSVGIITAVTPHIGYQAGAKIAKEALETNKPIRELLIRDGLLTETDIETILDPISMTEPGISGTDLLTNKGAANEDY